MTEAWAESPMLHRRFRRLLFAYPRGYRRRYGDEILTTLMDAAETGRQRPTAAETRDLLLGGLRQRFRLPVGRLMVVAALLTALTVGALGAALGSVAGWAMAAGLPGDDEVRELITLAAGEPYAGTVDRGRALLQPTADHGLLEPVNPGWTPQATEARLTAAGWRIDPYEIRPNFGAHYIARADGSLERVPADMTVLVAERDGLLLWVRATTYHGGPAEFREHTRVQATVRPAEPAAVLPMIVAGGLLGLVAGWMLTARVGYRLRRLPLSRRLPLVAVAAGSWAVLAPATMYTYRLVIAAVETAAGPAHTGETRLDLIPVYYHHYDNLLHGWHTVAGLSAGLLVVVAALVLRPARPEALETAGTA